MTTTVSIPQDDIDTLKEIKRNSAAYLPASVSLTDRILNQVDDAPPESISVTVARQDGSCTTVPITEQQLAALDLDLPRTGSRDVEITRATVSLAREIVANVRGEFGSKIIEVAQRIIDQLPYVITVERPDGRRGTIKLDSKQADVLTSLWIDTPQQSVTGMVQDRIARALQQ